MKKSIVALLHIGFWFCYLFIMLIILGAMYAKEGANMEAKIEKSFEILISFIVIPSAIAFYSFYFIVFPRIARKKKIIKTVGLIIFICTFSAVVGLILLSNNVNATCAPATDTQSTSLGVLTFISLVAFISGIVAMVIRGAITYIDEIKIKEVLSKKNHEMEMALVKAQLDPHFLFNTINNIDVLILKDAEQASSYLNKLSDIMRFMLFETKTDKILLSKEIEYIEKYMELQKIRTSNSTYASLKVNGVTGSRTIAPMVFIPFIENAFKHTHNKKTENAIIIRIYIESDFIKLECENRFDPSAKPEQESNGLGNDLIVKRLNLLYLDNHTLMVKKESDVYMVHLTIRHG